MASLRPLVCVALLVLLASGGAGCNLLSSGDAPSPPAPGEAPRVTIIEDPAGFERSAIQVDAFTIKEARVEGDSLALRISYGGGCAEHDFALYVTHAIYESSPPQADVFLAHDGNGDRCYALIEERLTFALTPLSEEAPFYLRVYPFQADEPISPLPLYEAR